MLAGGIFFGIVLGMKGSEWFGSQDPVVAAAPTATPEVADPVAPQPLEIPEAPAAVDAGIVAEAETPTDTVRHGTPGTRPATTAGTMTTAPAANDSAFAAFESPTGMTVTPTDLTSGMSAAAAPPLEAAAVQRVVSNNRRQLQTCYERAARGQANPPRARMDVSVTVGRSGTVTAVTASGTTSAAWVRASSRASAAGASPPRPTVATPASPWCSAPGAERTVATESCARSLAFFRSFCDHRAEP
jgi:hypothetical protein